MRKISSFSLFLASLLAGTFVASSCQFGSFVSSNGTSEKNSSSSSRAESSWRGSHSSSVSSVKDTASSSDGLFSSESDSVEDSSSSIDSSLDSSSSADEELQAQWAIVDALYALKTGEYLSGTHTLTGKVTSVTTRSGKVILKLTVEGREDKPVQCYNVQGSGVSSVRIGDVVTVSGKLTNYDGTFEFDSGCQLVPSLDSDDPYASVTEWEFYLNYSPAVSYEDANYRSLHGFMSGDLTVPDQAPTLASYQPKQGTTFLRNSKSGLSADGKSYTVVDGYGEEAFTVYQGGGYITLEEVAAYVFAFGEPPANYESDKNPDPTDSIWGEYLRANHSRFSGDTKKYPYEPELPNISGCGGSLTYYEMDIGTTGTDCDPSYPVKTYNNGYSIERGAARIVYGKKDLNNNGIYEQNELHLFYTYNHYNDFQEYLNYEGGWGKMFGNITGGGKLSSTSNYSPTPYVSVLFQDFSLR